MVPSYSVRMLRFQSSQRVRKSIASSRRICWIPILRDATRFPKTSRPGSAPAAAFAAAKVCELSVQSKRRRSPPCVTKSITIARSVCQARVGARRQPGRPPAKRRPRAPKSEPPPGRRRQSEPGDVIHRVKHFCQQNTQPERSQRVRGERRKKKKYITTSRN
jgi:hypothetical protein